MAELLLGALAPGTPAKSLVTVCGERLNESGQDLIRMVAEDGHLRVLPDVLEQPIHLHAVSETTTEVDVISAAILSEQQLMKISAIMEKRLSHKAKLNHKVDKSVMAGATVRVSGMIIDGSVRGCLECPTNVLQS